MTEHRDSHIGNDDHCRKDWSAPTLRSVTPVRRTRGGSDGRNGNQDTLFYDLS